MAAGTCQCIEVYYEGPSVQPLEQEFKYCLKTTNINHVTLKMNFFVMMNIMERNTTYKDFKGWSLSPQIIHIGM